MFRQDGRTALVTGAGRGMGVGIVRALAAQGARVIVNDFDGARAEETAAALRAEGAQATAVAFDVTDHGKVAEAVARLQRDVAPIDILVNNAGNAGTQRMQQLSFADTRPEDWQAPLAVNLNGVLNCTHAVVRGMCDRGWGRIVTISSEAGRRGMPIRVSLYGAAKAGAAHFMRHLSHEVAPFGVTANVISLGFMDNIGAASLAQTVRTIPVGRAGSPDDVGGAVVYLASDQAAWVTGETLVLNGGDVTTS